MPLHSNSRKVALSVIHSFKQDPKKNLKQISAQIGAKEGNTRVAFKRATGVTFTEYVKRKRLRFIRENQHLTNAELREKLGLVPSTLMPLIRELKARNQLTKGRLQVTHNAAKNGFYMPSSLPIMRLMQWISIQRGLSTPELSKMLNVAKNNINRVLKELIHGGFVKKKQKIGQRQYFVITSQGRQWIKEREEAQRKRDEFALKYPKKALSVLRRKQKEADTLERLLREKEMTKDLSPETILYLRRTLERMKIDNARMNARILLG